MELTWYAPSIVPHFFSHVSIPYSHPTCMHKYYRWRWHCCIYHLTLFIIRSCFQMLIVLPDSNHSGMIFFVCVCACVCVLGYLLAIHWSLEKFWLRCLCVSERFEENVLLKKSYSNNSLISVTYSCTGEEAWDLH